jgi:hypothetical protein
MAESVAVERTEGVRCSDADRERASERLRVAAGEGYLTMDELDERLSRVYAARYGHELDALVLDLPRATRWGAGGWLAILAMVWTQARMDLAGLFARRGSARGRRRVIMAVGAVLAVLIVAGAVLGGIEGFEGFETEGAEPPDADGDD